MNVKMQVCWGGGSKFYFRALVCGGLRVPSEDGVWTRAAASEMLDLLEVHGYNRSNVRFVW